MVWLCDVQPVLLLPLLLNLLLLLNLHLQLPMADCLLLVVPLTHLGQRAWLPAAQLGWLFDLQALLLLLLLLRPLLLLLPSPWLLLPAPREPGARSRHG